MKKTTHKNIVKREMFARYKQIWAIRYPNVEIKLYKKRVGWKLWGYTSQLKGSAEITEDTLRYYMDLLEKNFIQTAIEHFCCSTKVKKD
jgi:hypothetical protein